MNMNCVYAILLAFTLIGLKLIWYNALEKSVQREEESSKKVDNAENLGATISESVNTMAPTDKSC